MDDSFAVSRVLRRDGFKIEVMQADSYRSGGVVLGGDAAHVHSPVGARGMNLGIEDGMAFARRLAEGTLDGYTAERRPIGRRWIALSERVLAAAQASSPPLVLLRDVALWTAAHLPWMLRPMLKRVSGLVE
jgi:2-polyprenyl-6-methoxyphenol hydroxylase-like FAD-dependent oxidoreductase